jgi:hypothetical protein
MKTMVSTTTVIVLVIIVFAIVDLILAVFIIIESKKYRGCVNGESLFCLDFSCPYPFDTDYKSFMNPALQVPGAPVHFSTANQEYPDPNIAATFCAGFPYRLIDPKGEATNDNIECRYQNFEGMQTNKATTVR